MTTLGENQQLELDLIAPPEQLSLDFNENTSQAISESKSKVNEIITWGFWENWEILSEKEIKDHNNKKIWLEFWWTFDEETKKYALNWVEFDWIDDVIGDENHTIAIVYNLKLKNHKHEVYKTNEKSVDVKIETKKTNDKSRKVIDLRNLLFINWMTQYWELQKEISKHNPDLVKSLNNIMIHK